MLFVQHLSFARLPLNWASQERLITFLLKAAAFYQVASCVTRLRQPTSKRGGLRCCGRIGVHYMSLASQTLSLSLSLSVPFLYYLVARSKLWGTPAGVRVVVGLQIEQKAIDNTRTYVCVYSCTLCDKLRLVLIYITFRRQLPRLRAKPDILSFIFPY